MNLFRHIMHRYYIYKRDKAILDKNASQWLKYAMKAMDIRRLLK